MDAVYLKNNVYAALTEALTSMAVALPDDKVEYMGKYLLKYVERKKKREIEEEEAKELMQREITEYNQQEAKKVAIYTPIPIYASVYIFVYSKCLYAFLHIIRLI